MKLEAGKLLLTVAALAFLGSGVVAQITIENIENVTVEEASLLVGMQIAGTVHRPPVNLLDACAAVPTHGYIDADLDGTVDFLRQFGVSTVTEADWRTNGIRLLRPMRTQATLRAQADIATTLGVLIAVDAGQLSVSQLGAGPDAISTLSDDVRDNITAQSIQYLRGATVTGTRLVSLGDGMGLCYVVRYDAPLAANGFRTGRTAAGPSSEGESSAPSDDDVKSGGIEPPEPGVIGNF